VARQDGQIEPHCLQPEFLLDSLTQLYGALRMDKGKTVILRID